MTGPEHGLSREGDTGGVAYGVVIGDDEAGPPFDEEALDLTNGPVDTDRGRVVEQRHLPVRLESTKSLVIQTDDHPALCVQRILGQCGGRLVGVERHRDPGSGSSGSRIRPTGRS